MTLHPQLKSITERIIKRSQKPRRAYLDMCDENKNNGVRRAHLTCGNQAHAYAAMQGDKAALLKEKTPNLGIITAYNDMLSAHQPFETFPEIIREAARAVGATAQVAGGVPAMCDGITQGQAGMELSLFSRDTIALAAGIALSHNVFDAVVFLGVCDKIVPGLVMAATSFGHLPAVFLPAGPMASGLGNDEKAKVRQDFATGKADRATLMRAEMASYHGPGTCTFYGTANTNQMLMEFMGLHLAGTSFVPPNTPLRTALTQAGVQRALALSHIGESYLPVCEVLDEKAYVNGIIGLMATGGSTNLTLHLIAMARMAGIILTWQDFADLSAITPLLARIYPNGLADVNHMTGAGGLGFLIGQLLNAGLLHPDTKTVMGGGLADYIQEPKLINDTLIWQAGADKSLNDKILRPADNPFQTHGGLAHLSGNLGQAVVKTSALAAGNLVHRAKVRVFADQLSVKTAFQNGEFNEDVIVVVRYQGPRANGMPELHNLTPILGVLQDRGLRVALITDGRMSGASGKVAAAIHTSPEAIENGPLAYLQTGDMVVFNAETGVLEVEDKTVFNRKITHPDLRENQQGVGRDLFAQFRAQCGPATDGACCLY